MTTYNGIKVLIAEDDTLSQRVVQMLMKTLGCQAVIVENGRDAVSAFGQDEYKLVLLDYEMPQLDGPAAAAAIRSGEQSQGGTHRVLIYAMTGHSGNEELTRCRESGMDGHLLKPLSVDKLRAVLDEAVSR